MKIFKLLDLSFQTLFLSAIGLSLVLTVVDLGFIFWAFLALFFLGAWQLFSALTLGVGLSDSFRQLYLLTAISYCGLGWELYELLPALDLKWPFPWDLLEIAVPAFLIISFVAGINYYAYSYRTFNKFASA